MEYPKTNKRAKRIRAGRLAAYYAKLSHCDPDVVIHNEAPARRSDAHYLHTVLNTPRYGYDGSPELSICEELVSRGYDITTLNFSIDMKKTEAVNE